jgi:hypothetical protein
MTSIANRKDLEELRRQTADAMELRAKDVVEKHMIALTVGFCQPLPGVDLIAIRLGIRNIIHGTSEMFGLELESWDFDDYVDRYSDGMGFITLWKFFPIIGSFTAGVLAGDHLGKVQRFAYRWVEALKYCKLRN